MKRIEITEQIAQIIDDCELWKDNKRNCNNCVLHGACLERLTGDDSENQ